MAELLVAAGYLLFLGGVLLVFVGKWRGGIKLAVGGVLLIAKTLAFVAAMNWMQAQLSVHGAGGALSALAIPIAALSGLFVGVMLAIWLLWRAVRRLLAPPTMRAAIGAGLVGSVVAEALRERGRDDRRLR